MDNSGAVMFASADIGYEKVTNPAAKSTAEGAWIYVRGADFGYGASEFMAEVKGKGKIRVLRSCTYFECVSYAACSLSYAA